jgi:hypothetical protein
MNLEDQLALLLDKLRLPNGAALEPWLRKLLANPGSCVIIGIESPLVSGGPRVGIAWLSSTERLKVRKALTAINSSRQKKQQPKTTEIPYLD